MSDGQQETALERRVALPEPDVSNITVLTESLPNEPVLPWHHFDSPWLARDSAEAAEGEPEAPPEDGAEPEPGEQLTLELEVLVGEVEAAPPGSLDRSSPADQIPEESAA
ncbi:hypothetical protein [Nodosilinea nodulosa]|uniref:hypothetical protein n=1 Tax=Nodosilinea nodulosa TaxID=416001 RepID=UPI00030E5658|nr:hypothetical protein [Nodosilinea nodulosa]